MTDESTQKAKNSPRGMWLTLGTASFILVVLVALMAGGWIWHKKPSFCAVCHTPMKSYVDGYKGGDKTLMITQHATGANVVSCLDCHDPKIKQQATEAFHWVTGNYVFPLKRRTFGTRGFCLASGCHDEAKIIKATKDYGGAAPYNLHDPRHGKQECYRCHLTHGKSVLMCNQCHKLKLPNGWVSPSVNGVVPNK
jgi:Zn-finger protein